MPQPATLALAQQYSRTGDHAAAERICREIVRAEPTNALVWLHMGTSCLFLNHLEDAVAAYERALKCQPQFPEALNNLGVALSRLQRIEEAAATFRRAAASRANWAEPYISLGNLFRSNDRTDEAIAAYTQAVRSEPGNAEAHNLLASAFGRQGRRDEAVSHFLEAIRLQPRYAQAHSNLLLALNYDPDIKPETLLEEHRWWDRLHGQGLTKFQPHLNSYDPNRRLRIGYVSPDFRSHAVANFILPIFANHDPKQIEIFAYAEVPEPDETTARLRAMTSQWRSTCGHNDAQMADQIRADGIDVLVDLVGHTGGNRLAALARRPAPVQISYLGYPNTTGLNAIEYRLTDAVADPEGESDLHYVEQLIRLPTPWCCYEPPANAPEVTPLPMLANGFVTFGSMHNLSKLNPNVLDLWTDVLHAMPTSRLIVFRNTLDRSAQDRLMGEFTARGIDAQRIELATGSAKNAAHLAVYHRVDISLDAFPWSGHATTCESLWMGVPMVSLLGNRHAGRMSASILTAVGLSDMIAPTREEYVRIAVDLASDASRLSTLRSELRLRMKDSPLYDAPTFTRSLEAVYRQLWRRWCEKSAG